MKAEKHPKRAVMLLKYLLICEAATFLVEAAAAFIADGPFLAALREQMQWGLRAHIGVLIGVLVGCYWRFRTENRAGTEEP